MCVCLYVCVCVCVCIYIPKYHGRRDCGGRGRGEYTSPIQFSGETLVHLLNKT